jgi:hypothetical protein
MAIEDASLSTSGHDILSWKNARSVILGSGDDLEPDIASFRRWKSYLTLEEFYVVKYALLGGSSLWDDFLSLNGDSDIDRFAALLKESCVNDVSNCGPVSGTPGELSPCNEEDIVGSKAISTAVVASFRVRLLLYEHLMDGDSGATRVASGGPLDSFPEKPRLVGQDCLLDDVYYTLEDEIHISSLLKEAEVCCLAWMCAYRNAKWTLI